MFVRAPEEFGACLAAELLGLPHAAAGALWFRSQLPYAEPHNEARRAVGLPPDPAVTSPYRYLALAAMPPAWVAPDEPLPPTSHFIRPRPFEGFVDPTTPPWSGWQDGRPLVHATLGTTEVNRTPGVYETILDGLRDEPLSLIVGIGDQRDPADFGPQPGNVRIERFVSHAALLPRRDVVLTHGGYSTIMACLTFGVLMVVLPVNADQPRNARRCADLGVARVIDADERTPAAIRAATRAVLHDPAYRANAARMRDDIAALPGPEQAIVLLERLASDRMPRIAPT